MGSALIHPDDICRNNKRMYLETILFYVYTYLENYQTISFSGSIYSMKPAESWTEYTLRQHPFNLGKV